MTLSKASRSVLCMICLCALFEIEASGQERNTAPPRPGIPADSVGEIIPSPPAAMIRSPVTSSSRPVIPVDLPVPDVLPGFGLPEGLVTKPEILFLNLGFGPTHCFVLTPITCFDAGYKCYSLGMYQDALAFVNHGLKQSNHARLYLLKAVCEMHLGHCQDAETAIMRYRAAASIPSETFGLGPAQERINEPMRVRLEYLLMATR